MNTKVEEVKTLLAKLYFLPWEQTQNILSKCEGVSDNNVKKVIAVLRSALKEQEEIIGKLVKADPTFPSRFDEFLARQVTATTTQHDAS